MATTAVQTQNVTLTVERLKQLQYNAGFSGSESDAVMFMENRDAFQGLEPYYRLQGATLFPRIAARCLLNNKPKEQPISVEEAIGLVELGVEALKLLSIGDWRQINRPDHKGIIMCELDFRQAIDRMLMVGGKFDDRVRRVLAFLDGPLDEAAYGQEGWESAKLCYPAGFSVSGEREA